MHAAQVCRAFLRMLPENCPPSVCLCAEQNLLKEERVALRLRLSACPTRKSGAKTSILPAFCAGTKRLLSFVDAALVHTPRPSSRASRGRLSPDRGWQVKPEPQRAVYTPHACPSPRAHVMQQPQPGSLTLSAQSLGGGLHCSSALASHGSHRTTGPTEAARRAKAASAAARHSTQRLGIVGMKQVTQGQSGSCHTGLGELSVTRRGD